MLTCDYCGGLIPVDEVVESYGYYFHKDCEDDAIEIMNAMSR